MLRPSVAPPAAPARCPVAALVASPPRRSPDVPAPVAGCATGIGDRYFPLDGNGGYDVTHYDVHDTYRPAGRPAGRTSPPPGHLDAASRSFHLDLVLTADAVAVDGTAATFTKPRSHELVVTPATPVAGGQQLHGPGRATTAVRRRCGTAASGRGCRRARRGHRHQRAAHGAVVVPGQRPPARQGHLRRDLPGRRGAGRWSATGSWWAATATGRWTAWHWRMTEPMATYLAFVAAGRFRVEQGSSRRAAVPTRSRAVRPTGSRTPRCGCCGSTPRMVRVAGDPARALPVRLHRRRGHLALPRLRPGEPERGRRTPTSAPDATPRRHWWCTSWPTSGSATTSRCGAGATSGSTRDSRPAPEWRYAETHGRAAASTGCRQYAARPAGRPFWELRVDDPGAGRMFDAPVYERGAMTLQALRHRIGGTAFSCLLRTWVAASTAAARHGPGSSRRSPRRSAGSSSTGSSTPGCTRRARPARTGRERSTEPGLGLRPDGQQDGAHGRLPHRARQEHRGPRGLLGRAGRARRLDQEAAAGPRRRPRRRSTAGSPTRTLNTCYNALDRHVVAGHGDRTALIYDSAGRRTPGRRYTYAQLLEQVAAFAGALRGFGVDAGDRVVIYMPMIPEAVIAMLACARLGAVHSVVFGGFAAARARGPHRRRPAQGGRHRVLRHRAEPGRGVQADARPGAGAGRAPAGRGRRQAAARRPRRRWSSRATSTGTWR